MAKIRIHELAKRVGLSTKEVVERLRAAGVEVRSNLSSVDESTEKLLKPAASAPAPQTPAPREPAPQAPAAPARPAAAQPPASTTPARPAPARPVAPPPSAGQPA